MRYSRLLLLGLYAFALILIGVFLSKRTTGLTNPATLAAELLFIATLAFILLFVPRRSAPLELLLVTLCCIFFLTPFIGYQLYPDRFPFGGGVPRARLSASLVTVSVLFLWAGTIALVAGFRLGALPFRRDRSVAGTWYCPPWQYLVVAVPAVFYEVWLALRYQTHTTVITAEREGGFMRRLVHTDAVILVGCVLAAAHWRRFSRPGRWLMGGVLLTGIVYRALSGSRAAMFTVLLTLLIIAVNLRGDFRIPARTLLLLMIACLVSILAFPVATFARTYWDLSARYGRYLSPAEFARVAGQYSPDGVIFSSNFVYGLFFRLNGLDPLAVIVKGDAVELEKYVSLRNDLQSFINVAVPGTPFPDALERSKTFLVIYRDYPPEYLKQHYVTTMWTLWGDAMAHFRFAGGLLAMLMIGIFLSVVFHLLWRWRSQYALFLQVWWLLTVYYAICSFGFDTTAATSLYLLLPIVVILTALRLVGAGVAFLRFLVGADIGSRNRVLQ